MGEELVTPRETVLEEASRLVDGDRQTAYGHPRDNHACTAALWTAYFKRCGLLRDDAELTPRQVCIAKITGTSFGYEDHGVLSIWLHLDYGGSGQGAGGYVLDSFDKELNKRVPHAECGRWVAGVIGACGVGKWEDVKGRTVIAIRDQDGWGGTVVGLRPLPTESGAPFFFQVAE